MGIVNTVGIDKFPKQGSYLGLRVEVMFNYDTSRTLTGLVVREDAEEPGLMIIQLSDGRFVLSTECQYRPLLTLADLLPDERECCGTFPNSPHRSTCENFKP